MVAVVQLSGVEKESKITFSGTYFLTNKTLSRGGVEKLTAGRKFYSYLFRKCEERRRKHLIELAEIDR